MTLESKAAALRLDAARPIEKAKKLSNGFLMAPVTVGKVGVVSYLQADGSVFKELRTAEELGKAAALDSLRLRPVTNNHPPRNELPLTPDNIKSYQVGYVGDSIEFDKNHLKMSLVITDGSTIADIESGKVQVSPGYFRELDMTPGVYQGERYDAVQTNIVYDHLAVVAAGRAGASVSIQLDAADGTEVITPMEKDLVIDGVTYKVSEQVAQAFTKYSEQMSARLDSAKEDFDKINAEKEQLDKARLDAESPERFTAAVKARVQLERAASQVLSDEVQLDALSDKEIKLQVIKAVYPTRDLANRSDDYINATYDIAVDSKSAKTVTNVNLDALRVQAPTTTEVVTTNSAVIRAKQIQEMHNAWQRPIASKNTKAV